MSEKPKFNETLRSYEMQAAENGCTCDWVDYFHMAVRDYFEKCEKNNKRATIAGLKREIIKTAESEDFNFE